MRSKEFNDKWVKHLEPGHYGMSIGTPGVCEYLDKRFEEYAEKDPEFEYSQIKVKFGRVVIYATAPQEFINIWENRIQEIIDNSK